MRLDRGRREFDASWDRGSQPSSCELSNGQVDPGGQGRRARGHERLGRAPPADDPLAKATARRGARRRDREAARAAHFVRRPLAGDSAQVVPPAKLRRAPAPCHQVAGRRRVVDTVGQPHLRQLPMHAQVRRVLAVAVVEQVPRVDVRCDIACAFATDSRIRLTTGKLCLKPGPSGIGRPSQTTFDARRRSNSRVTPSTRRRYSAIQDGLPNGPDVPAHARHVVVRVVGAEGEHDDLRVHCRGHLLDAREPVVEIGARKPRRQPALDADDVDLRRRCARARHPGPARASRRRPRRAADAPR